MLIGIVTSGLPFNGNTIKTQALGGSETAVICIARELAKRGNKVKVYCNCPEPGIIDGVEYYDRAQFGAHSVMTSFDVLIASRWIQYLATYSRAALRVAWCHDILTSPDQFMPGLWQTDLLMLLSDYHIQDYCGPADLVPEENPRAFEGKLHLLRKHVWKTANGVDMDVVKANKRPKVPNKLIYTSRPERGFEVLLAEILPRLLKKNPKLTLFHCTYDLQGLPIAPEIQEIYKRCEALAARYPRNVINLGGLNKEGLYQQISSSQLVVYPTAFPEIFHIGAIEAQALGTPIVTTDDFACKETTGDGGIRIPGPNNTEEYFDAFADTVLRLLSDKEEYAKLSKAGPEFVESRGYTWAAIAGKWEAKFKSMLEERYAANKSRVVKEMAREGNVVAAALTAEKEGLPEAAELSEMAKQLEVRPLDPSEITLAYKKALPQFEAALQCMRATNKKPRKVLDYLSGDVCFGIVLKKLVPDADVTVFAATDEIAECIRAQAKQSNLDINVTSEEPEKGITYDTVFIGWRLEECPNPQSMLADVRARYQTNSDSDVTIIASRFLGTPARYDGTVDRLWNFDVNDFQTMLGNAQYSLNYVDARAVPTDPPQGYWVIILGKCKTFNKLDIKERARRTRPYQNLSVCFITKNEEDWISGAIRSAKDVADEVVVVDTGSTDTTVDICESLGARVVKTEFDNFAQARNIFLDEAKGDWILWFDADERLVGGPEIRKYLNSHLFEGYAIRQNHLMLDSKSFDLPVRLFKHRPHYRFVGMIHEHCEDVSEGKYDQEIRPTLSLDEVDLAHYGYLNEKMRRRKCSFRNMELLQRDIRENGDKGRMLTWVLVERDYINQIKWSFARNNGKIAPGSFEHELLNAVVTTHLHYFGDKKSKYYKLSEGIYQDALMLLGRNGLCYSTMSYPPFQVDLGIAGAVGGMEEDKHVKPDRKWFLNDAEFVQHMHEKSTELVTKMRIAAPGAWDGAFTPKTFEVDVLPDPIKLLDAGVRSTVC